MFGNSNKIMAIKKINDSYGHSAGDMILKQLAEIILKTIRKNDDIATKIS